VGNCLVDVPKALQESKLRLFIKRFTVHTATQSHSDIEILVELDHTQPIGMKFFAYQPELEELLKIKIDLVST